jgi:hypothetical protein
VPFLILLEFMVQTFRPLFLRKLFVPCQAGCGDFRQIRVFPAVGRLCVV